MDGREVVAADEGEARVVARGEVTSGGVTWRRVCCGTADTSALLGSGNELGGAAAGEPNGGEVEADISADLTATGVQYDSV